ncbi:hypothetical protein PWYN_22970 [Paenibacillus wynnii]|uniref:Uncharacterized protein n=1 Tax=Paenibacillus wynnii TaxID=268407 RepID=A0A098M600_9BACL|nr:hypothetical protein PWYN_22970 [Paenibacillus wynnii]
MKFDGIYGLRRYYCPKSGALELPNMQTFGISSLLPEALSSLKNVFSAAEITKFNVLNNSMTSNIIGGLDSFVQKNKQR